jgi:nicotinamide-nucleotide amidase
MVRASTRHRSVPVRYPRRMTRVIASAELLSIGTELTTGGTRDTNAGDLARELSDAGVWVGRLTALPDDLDVVTEAFSAALARVDLVVSTGGLGPTPDDLTRESIAAALGETPTIDPVQERWLRGLWRRRGQPFPISNLKQAWLIPSATAIANHDGSAPGWWVDRPDGRVVVAMPGPPREMGPMWRERVLPRLRERGLGIDRVVHTLRLTGIGESLLADVLGPLLLARNPVVATYARHDAVDIRITAVDEPAAEGHPARAAADIAAEGLAAVEAAVGTHIWGHGLDTWAEAIDRALGARGWRLATVEVGTDGAVVALLGSARSLVREVVLSSAEIADDQVLVAMAARARKEAGADIGVGVAAVTAPEGLDTALTVAVVDPSGSAIEHRAVLMRGDVARARVASAVAALLLERLRGGTP